MPSPARYVAGPVGGDDLDADVAAGRAPARRSHPGSPLTAGLAPGASSDPVGLRHVSGATEDPRDGRDGAASFAAEYTALTWHTPVAHPHETTRSIGDARPLGLPVPVRSTTTTSRTSSTRRGSRRWSCWSCSRSSTTCGRGRSHRHPPYLEMWEWLWWTGLITFSLLIIESLFVFDYFIVLADRDRRAWPRWSGSGSSGSRRSSRRTRRSSRASATSRSRSSPTPKRRSRSARGGRRQQRQRRRR